MATKTVYEDGELSESELARGIALTEEEIALSAFDDDEPENDGNRDLERMENEDGDPVNDAGDDVEDEEGDEPEGDLDEADEQGDPDHVDAGEQRQERRGDPEVPLRAERARVRKLETELAEMRGRIDQIGRMPVTPAPEVKPVPRPDPLVDPEGWERAVRSEISSEFQQTLVNQRVETTFADAADQHGKDFDFAYSQLTSLDRANPEHRAIVQGIVKSPNPGKALMKWAEPKLTEGREARIGEARQTLIDAGVSPEDVDAILESRQQDHGTQRGPSRNERQANNARREGRQANSQPRHETRGPVRLPSLNSAAGGGSHRARDGNNDPRGLDGSESAIFDYAFKD